MLNTRTRRKSFTTTDTPATSELAQRVTQLQAALEQQTKLIHRLIERVDPSASSTARNRKQARANGVNGCVERPRGTTLWDAAEDESEGSTGIEQMINSPAPVGDGGVGRKGKGKKAEGRLY